MTANSPSSRDGISENPREEISALSLPQSPPLVLSQSRTEHPTTVFAIWAHRVGVMVFVSACAVFGVLLMILPWTPKWTDNYILISYPALRDFLEDGFVRGVCTGLGVIDIWIGFSEATHYQEREHQA